METREPRACRSPIYIIFMIKYSFICIVVSQILVNYFFGHPHGTIHASMLSTCPEILRM